MSEEQERYRFESFSIIEPEVRKEETDAEKAQRIRLRLEVPLRAVAAIVEEARQGGLVVSFDISADEYGRVGVRSIGVVRPL